MLGNQGSKVQRHDVLQEVRDRPEAYFHIRRSVAAIKSIWQKRAATNHTQITTIFDSDMPEVLAIDALKIQHCLNNLVENAVKVTKNGHVKIIVSKMEMANEKSYIALSVQDTGSGLSPSQVSTIFNRNSYCAAERELVYGAIDTGLPMTHDLMSELGGKVLVQSTPGRGSVFALLLPFKPSLLLDYDMNKAESKIDNIASYSHFNILVVDDYNLNQLTIKTLLDDHVGKIFSAIHGYEALEIMHSCRVDVIFMDINMPIMDGCEATLKIRSSGQDWAGVHIFAMTADPQYHHTQLYRKIGMDGTLPKPFRKDDILRILENCAVPYKRAACE